MPIDTKKRESQLSVARLTYRGLRKPILSKRATQDPTPICYIIHLPAIRANSRTGYDYNIPGASIVAKFPDKIESS